MKYLGKKELLNVLKVKSKNNDIKLKDICYSNFRGYENIEYYNNGKKYRIVNLGHGADKPALFYDVKISENGMDYEEFIWERIN